MKCRHCNTPLSHDFLDLGYAPPSNAYLDAADLEKPELYFPLKTKVCNVCWLVQTEDYADASLLFNNSYAYFSSTSTSWLEHARQYFEMIRVRVGLTEASRVIEIAANDGYLLRNFVLAGIPCLGIEPTASTASAAEKSGVPILKEFFSAKLGEEIARRGEKADLIIGNNVFAHVPDINGFSLGIRYALHDEGTVTLEFPHIMRLIEHAQFDTVYHEHFSYFSLTSALGILKGAGLRVYDVEELSTHGGSLRIYACHVASKKHTEPTVSELLAEEGRRGLRNLSTYQDFQGRANRVKDDLLAFLIDLKRDGKRVAAYGAAAKGNTLLNYAGIKTDLLPFVCDAAPSKQGKFMPGSHIPILHPSVLAQRRLDYLLVLPWNIAGEVRQQNERLCAQGVRIVVSVPKLRTL
jgi:hypothetical protein